MVKPASSKCRGWRNILSHGNAGVLLRLLEELEQQEGAEAVQTYFVSAQLVGQPGSQFQLNQACEDMLRKAPGISIDFDIEATARPWSHWA